ncbi:response regulator [Puia sp. P3]|uniref:response regulator n=1 Tax=Puia sp. P3 TaxID=3423952 RepID=UPI003D665147
MKKQILAIDDSKAIRFLLQTVLGRSYQVVTVPDGYSAMYYLSNRELPDIIIADPQLPDMEEWELIAQLSTSGLYGEIPLIVLSGLDEEETAARSLQYGAVKYFSKPFNPVDLVNFLGNMVRNDSVKAS